jgi:outer membrane protein assembly factor BamD
MKNIFYLLSILLLFTSCSEYQKVLKQKDIKPKFDMANRLYEEGLKEDKDSKLTKAIKLYEQILPGLQGKPQAQIISYNIANAYYNVEDYLISGYKFERFAKVYSSSTKLEEAIFKSSDSYYQSSPPYSLDQSETLKAMDKLQVYINQYPDGQYFQEANQKLQELRLKIEKKYYEIAKQYHYTTRYKAAISDFDNYLVKYPGSAYKEKAYFYKLESAYILAINSFAYLVAERLQDAKRYYEDYKERFPEGEFIEQANTYMLDIENRLENINDNIVEQK